MASRKGLRTIAVIEAFKGLLVLIAGLGLFRMFHIHGADTGERIVKLFHFNPASHYPRIFIQAANAMHSGRLWWLATGAAAYVLLRFVEAYGLWRERRWGEWLGVVSAGMYVPVELLEVSRKPTVLNVSLFTINIIVVIYLARALELRHVPKSSDE